MGAHLVLTAGSFSHIPRAVPPLAFLSLMLVAALCALVDMEFEACVLLFGYLTTELSTWPPA